jgi:transposase-like protein
MSSKQELKIKTKTPKDKKKRQPDKPRKEYDERLTMMNKHIRELMNQRVGEVSAICPSCKSYNAKPLTPRRGILVGIKPCFRCKNCGRIYVSDNDSYRNVYLKLMAMRAVAYGGPSMASSASKLLYDYGVNAEYSPDYLYLKKMIR